MLSYRYHQHKSRINNHTSQSAQFPDPSMQEYHRYPEEPLPSYSPFRSSSDWMNPDPDEKPPLPDDQSYMDTTESIPDYSSLSEHQPFLLPPATGRSAQPGPGFAAESLLTRGLQVPSRSSRITSGFEYPSILARYSVSESDWTRFTREITSEAALSGRQWTTAIGMGLGTLAIGGMIFGFLGTIPAVLVARKARQHREQRNLAAAVAPGSASALARRIETWNECFFRPRGIMIRVDLPYEAVEDMDVMDINTSEAYRQAAAQAGDRSFRQIFGRRSSHDDETARTKASRKGRIVIIPLEGPVT